MAYTYSQVNEDSSQSKASLPELICVEVPGYGNNTEKMLESLGGIKKISEVYYDENRRMELRYRPNDLFCKPLCGERTKTTSLLLHITYKKKKKKKQHGKEESKGSTDPSTCEDPGVYDIKQLGVVRTTFKFENMCDFQYLPLKADEKEGSSGWESMYDNLLPQGMLSSDWLEEPASLFLPPATFSRMDTPQDYRFKTEPIPEKNSKTPQNVICRTRQKRSHHAIFHSFKDEGVPQNPLPEALNQIRYKLVDSECYRRLVEEFSNRPIWSKNALRVRLKYSKDKLKILMPTISYYFHTGPWRNLWVKFGYDPRKDPNSWLYQTFDFRIRQAGGAKTKVEAKRNYSNYTLPYKSVHNCKKKTSLVSSIHLGEETAADADEKKAAMNESKFAEGLSEEFYLFRPGMVPPYRQMFYQYCDIHLPKIQKLLESSILKGANSTCSEKNGWLPFGVENTCRDILSNLIEKTLAERNAKGENLQDELMSESEEEDSSDGNSDEGEEP